MPETLAAGDLTTAFTKWLATKTSPKNEVIRAALNANYSTSKDDIARNITRFLHDRA